VACLPLYERMREILPASPGPAFTGFNFLPFVRNAFQELVLRRSFDEIGRQGDWQLHVDGAVLTAPSAGIITFDGNFAGPGLATRSGLKRLPPNWELFSPPSRSVRLWPVCRRINLPVDFCR